MARTWASWPNHADMAKMTTVHVIDYRLDGVPGAEPLCRLAAAAARCDQGARRRGRRRCTVEALGGGNALRGDAR